MAYIQPTSEVWLCANVPLDPSYDNQLTFTSGTGANRVWDEYAQRAYFASKAVYHPTNFSIVKERDGVLRMSGEVSNFYNINYMYFVNPPFTSGVPTKYFYAFVTQVEYINPNTTFIYFELDYFQTWASNIEWMESVIEREHVEHDEMYANLEDEGIEVNDLEPYQDVYLDDALGQKILVVGSTQSYVDLLTKADNEGISFSYMPYNRDYPVYQTENITLKEAILQDLRCYNGNTEVGYNQFYYDNDTKQISIKGLSDVNIDTVKFTLLIRMSEGNWWSKTIEGGYLAWYVKASRTGSEWYFSIDGIRVPYNIYDNYPAVSTAGFKGIANMLLKDSNNNYINTSKEGYSYLMQMGGHEGWLMYSDVVPQAGYKMTFIVQLRRPLHLTDEYYDVVGTFDGSTWTFAANT